MFVKNLSTLILATFITIFATGCAQKSVDNDMKSKMSVNYTSSSLVEAVKKGDLDLVSKHLLSKVSPNTKDSQGNTLLHLSITAKNDKMLKLLLDNNASINDTNALGFTPLHLAVTENTQSLILILLNRGAATEILNNKGFAAIHTATQKNYLVVIKMLLKQHISDMKLRSKKGLTPLLVAIESGHFKLIKYYLKNKADLKAVTNDKLTALQLSMRSKSLQTVDFLLKKKGGTLQQLTATGKTLLHLAAEAGSAKIVRFLIKKGLKVTVKDKKKRLALDYAVENGHAPVVVYLLKSHSKLSTASKLRLLKTAVKAKDTKMLLALHIGGIKLSTIEPKTQSSILHYAVSLDGMEDVIALILKKTELIVHKDAKKLTALDYAKKAKKASYVKIMKPFYLKVLIKRYIAKDDFLKLKALRKKYPEVLELIKDKKYKLALNGPEDLMIGDLKLLSKKGRSQSILIAQIKRLKTAYQHFSSKEIGLLVSYGLPAPVIAAVINKTDALVKEIAKTKEEKALKKIQESLLKVQKLALEANTKVVNFQEVNINLIKQLLEKQEQIIQEQIATKEAIQSSSKRSTPPLDTNTTKQVN